MCCLAACLRCEGELEFPGRAVETVTRFLNGSKWLVTSLGKVTAELNTNLIIRIDVEEPSNTAIRLLKVRAVAIKHIEVLLLA